MSKNQRLGLRQAATTTSSGKGGVRAMRNCLANLMFQELESLVEDYDQAQAVASTLTAETQVTQQRIAGLRELIRLETGENVEASSAKARPAPQGGTP